MYFILKDAIIILLATFHGQNIFVVALYYNKVANETEMIKNLYLDHSIMQE